MLNGSHTEVKQVLQAKNARNTENSYFTVEVVNQERDSWDSRIVSIEHLLVFFAQTSISLTFCLHFEIMSCSYPETRKAQKNPCSSS